MARNSTPAAPPRRRRTQEERRAETRGRVLDATIACLLELGYGATTQRAVSDRSGVTRGAQLHHFPTRAQLVAEATTRLAIQLTSRRIGPGRRTLAKVEGAEMTTFGLRLGTNARAAVSAGLRG